VTAAVTTAPSSRTFVSSNRAHTLVDDDECLAVIPTREEKVQCVRRVLEAVHECSDGQCDHRAHRGEFHLRLGVSMAKSNTMKPASALDA